MVCSRRAVYQTAHDRLDTVVGQALRLFPGLTGDGMRDDHDRVRW